MGRNEILSIVFCNLNRTNERLAEVITELLVEKQQKRNRLHTVAMNPILELPYVGNISNGLPLNRHVAPRENVMIPTSSSWPSNNGIETLIFSYLFFLGFQISDIIFIFNLVKF